MPSIETFEWETTAARGDGRCPVFASIVRVTTKVYTHGAGRGLILNYVERSVPRLQVTNEPHISPDYVPADAELKGEPLRLSK